MKQIIALFALTFSMNAFASAEGFVTDYTLDTFQISAQSQIIPFAANISGGTVALNMKTRELQLTLFRHFACPAHTMCPMFIPAPIVITLPIAYQGSGFCGGLIITAQEDVAPVNGPAIAIHLFDDNGNVCEKPGETTFIKPVHISITEQSSRDNPAIVSEVSGFPVNR